MRDFFISYAGSDREWAAWIAWELESQGYTTILQDWDFAPGMNFVLEMQKASADSERTLAILSRRYLDRLFTQPEWAAAFARDPLGRSRSLVPIRVEDCDSSPILGEIVFIDLHGLDEEGARKALLDGIRRLGADRGKPARAPAFPRRASSPRPFPGGAATTRPARRRLIHAQITADGLLDLQRTENPYLDLNDPTAVDGTAAAVSAVSCFLWLPHSEYLASPRLQPLTPAACVCTAAPAAVFAALWEGLGAERMRALDRPPREMRKEEKELLLTTLAGQLSDCFVAAITVPALLLGIGHRRSEFAYQAFVDLFLAPVVEMHRRIGFEQLDLRLAHVGDRDSFLLRVAKRQARACYPTKGACSVDFAAVGREQAMVHLARLISWAVGTYYNSGDERWLALLDGGEAKPRHP